MKIMITGFSGSGKSTLAKNLSERLSLPVCYLDTVFWLPGWQERTVEEQQEILGAFMDENSEKGWVIDGNYSKNLFARRAGEADYILFMNFSRLRCALRIIRRYFTFRGTSRFSITDGCDEKLDREFILWVLRDSRTDAALEKYARLREQYPDKFRELRNPRSLRSFLDTLPGLNK